jgi:hypothetical protein
MSDESTELPAPSELDRIVSAVRTDAQRARRVGNVCVATSLLVGGLILFIFLYAGQVVTVQRFELQKDQQERLYREKRDYAELLAKISDQKADSSSSGPLMKDLAQQLLKHEPAENVLDDLLYNITSSIVRIGAVLVGIFVIQILVTFGRYYYKVAEHLGMTATLIMLSEGKPAALKVMAPLLLPSKIDFGNAPTSPLETTVKGAFDTIKELAKKVPGH